jgi:hypothetical protein
MEPVSNRKGENNLGSSEVEDQGAGEMVAQQGEEGPTTKKPRDEDEEEELLTILNRFRNNWLETMSPFVGPLDATSKFSDSPHNNMTQDLHSPL